MFLEFYLRNNVTHPIRNATKLYLTLDLNLKVLTLTLQNSKYSDDKTVKQLFDLISSKTKFSNLQFLFGMSSSPFILRQIDVYPNISISRRKGRYFAIIMKIWFYVQIVVVWPHLLIYQHYEKNYGF